MKKNILLIILLLACSVIWVSFARATTTKILGQGGLIDQAIDFDAVDDEVNLGSAADIDNMTTLTFAAWINPDTDGSVSNKYIYSTDGSSDGDGFALCLIDTGTRTIALYVDTNSTNLVRISNDNSIPLNEWSYVAVTWTGNIGAAADVHIYVDGNEVSYQTSTNGVGTFNDSTNNKFIGNVFSAGGGTFDGEICAPCLWNTVLSEAEINQCYNAYTYQQIRSVRPANIVRMFEFEDVPVGASFDGVSIKDSAGIANATGSDGANNTGLICTDAS